MKKQIFLTVCVLLMASFVLVPVTTARYAFDYYVEFGAILLNLDGNYTNICNVYKENEFVVADGTASYGDISVLKDGYVNHNYSDESIRWTNYSADWRTRTDAKSATITFEWGDAISLKEIDLYFYVDSNIFRLPVSGTLEYKNQDGEWITITNKTETKVNYTTKGNANNADINKINGAKWNATTYTGVAPTSAFKINGNIFAYGVRITLNAQTYNGNYNYCVGLVEVAILT